jgi:hypothetical protein
MKLDGVSSHEQLQQRVLTLKRQEAQLPEGWATIRSQQSSLGQLVLDFLCIAEDSTEHGKTHTCVCDTSSIEAVCSELQQVFALERDVVFLAAADAVGSHKLQQLQADELPSAAEAFAAHHHNRRVKLVLQAAACIEDVFAADHSSTAGQGAATAAATAALTAALDQFFELAQVT